MHDYQELFSHFERSFNPRPELVGLVLRRVATERRRVAVRQASTFAMVCLGAAGALVVSGRELLLEISQSGFIDLGSIAFSDARLVAQHWQDYTLSLLEALPAFSAAAVLMTTLVILAALRGLIGNLAVLRDRHALPAA